jgi:AraC-like DNA-binding protein
VNQEKMKENYSKISIENFAKQVNVDLIVEEPDFIISKKPTVAQEHSFDFNYPYIMEGVIFVFCVKGSGKIRLNLAEYELQEKCVLIVVPNNIVQVIEQSEDSQAELLFFTFDYISNIGLINELGNITKMVDKQPYLRLNQADWDELLAIHRLIVKQFEKNGDFREEIIKSYFYAMVYQILQIYTINTSVNGMKHQNRKEQIHTRFISLLFEHYKTQRSVRFYAGKLFLTPKYFARVIKEVSGKSVLERINEMVVVAAKALLKGSDMTVSQIADELNFPNASFFGTYFKKQVGMTPVQYRENGKLAGKKQ